MWGTGILKGMWVTIKNMMRGPITVQYPEQKLVLPERSRWAVAPKFDEEGNSKCTACLNCVRACPDHILEMRTHADENKRKHIDEFTYEIGACMFCGLCVEACPFDALCMSKDYELATDSTDCLTVTLLKDRPTPEPRRAKAAEVDHKSHEPQREGAEESTKSAAKPEQPASAAPVVEPPSIAPETEAPAANENEPMVAKEGDDVA